MSKSRLHSAPKPRTDPRTSSATRYQYNTLFVTVDRSRFPDYINARHLRDHFADFSSNVVSAVIVRDGKTNKSKGYGFIQFTSQAVAAKAMSQYKGTKLRDKFPLFIGYNNKITDSVVGSYEAKLSTTDKSSSHDDNECDSDTFSTNSEESLPEETCRSTESCVMFVRPVGSQFPDYVTTEDLRRHCRSKCDKDVVNAYIRRNRNTKRTKGFGCVKFTSLTKAKEGKTKLDGSLLLGKIPLLVDFHHKVQSKQSAPTQVLKNVSEPLECTSHQVSIERLDGLFSQAKPFKKRNSSTPSSASIDHLSASPIKQDDNFDTLSTSSEDSFSEETSKSCIMVVSPVNSQFPDYVTTEHLRKHCRSKCDRNLVNAYIQRNRHTKRTRGFGCVKFTSLAAAKDGKAKLDGSLLLGKFPLLVDFRHQVQSRPSAPTQVLKSFNEPLERASHQVHLKRFNSPSSQTQSSKKGILTTPSSASFDHPSSSVSSIKQDNDFDTLSTNSENSFLEDNSTGSCIMFVSPVDCQFPDYVTTEHIRRYFQSKCAKDVVVNAFIRRHRSTKKTRGFGCVKFVSLSAAKEAKAKLSGSLLLGKFPLRIDFQRDKTGFTTSKHALKRVDEAFRCTPHQMRFLQYQLFDFPSSQAQSLKKMIPAKLVNERGIPHLVGSKVDVKTSIQLVKQFLSDFKHTTVSYHCQNVFASILEESILPEFKESQRDTTCIMKAQKSWKEPDTSKIVVDVFSRKLDELNHVSKTLKDLEPQSKLYFLQPESSTLENIPTYIETIEKKYLVKAERRGQQSVLIHGFGMEVVENAWLELKEAIESFVIVTRNVPITAQQFKYIQTTQSSVLERAQAQCELTLPDFKSTYEITLKGNLTSVTQSLDSIKLAISQCKFKELRIHCPQKHLGIWKKRWNTFSEEQRIENGVIVEYVLPTKMIGNVAVCFTLYGDNNEAIEKAAQAVARDENGLSIQTQEIELSDQECQVLKTNLKKIQEDLEQTSAVYVCPDSTKKQVNVVAPVKCKLDMFSIKEKLLYLLASLTSKPVTKRITFNDKVVVKLLPSQPILDGIEKYKSVVLRILNSGESSRLVFQLEGQEEEVDKAKVYLRYCAMCIKPMFIATKRLPSAPKYTPVISSDQFTSFMSTLQQDLGVVCYRPTSQGLLAQTHVLCSSGSICTIQLCEGHIEQEEVDAVIAPTDMHLRTTSKIALAAGTELSELCTEYLLEKKPKLGDVIEIDCGNLPFHSLLLAVVERDFIDKAIKKAFQLACESRYGSVSISSMPLVSRNHTLTRVVLSRVDSVIKTCSHHALHTIRIVLPPNESVTVLSSKEFEKYQMRENRATVASSMSESALLTPDSSCPLLPPRTHLDQHASSSSPLATKHKWLWQDDNKQYVEYSQDISNQLTTKWKADPTSVTYVKVNKQFYFVNFQSMTQTNNSTKRERKILLQHTTSTASFSPIESTSAKWFYLGDSRQYVPYESTQSNMIEKMHQGEMPVVPIKIGKWLYSFDFEEMTQVNGTTNRKRAIQRKPSDIKPTQKETLSTHDCDSEMSLNDCYIGLRGHKEKIDVAAERITSQLQSLTVTKSTTLPQGLNITGSRLKRIVENHKYVYIHKGSTGDKLYIEGDKQSVLDALTDIQEEIISFSREDVGYPVEWEQQTVTSEVFEVTKDSPEWRDIFSLFRATMPDYKVMSIKRVQNKWLWEKYQNDKKRMDKKNGGVVNEMSLFHGSRKTSAEDIVHSEEGLDMRFSSDGMWGRANYFAVKASYSDTYAYQHPIDHQKELFVAKVLTGDSITLRSDSSLRMPPEKESFASNTEVTPKKIRYDTVNGVTHGSKVYMTYSNDKAYPAYIIKYKKELMGPGNIVRASRTVPRNPFLSQPYTFGNSRYV